MKVLNGIGLEMYMEGTTEQGVKKTRWNFMDNGIDIDLYKCLEEYRKSNPGVVHIKIHIALPVVGYSELERRLRPIALEVPDVD